ncbi:MAG TPA: ATP-binding protein [Gemmatimonadales bacterium]|nr:ATP-binding protein [Gemmatimonadales bacterium]
MTVGSALHRASRHGGERPPIFGAHLRPVLLRYGTALLCTLAALAATLALRDYLGSSPTVLFFGAVAVSAWYGGWGPGLFAAIGSSVAVEYFFAQPVHTFMPITAGPIIRLIVFLVVSIGTSALTQSLHRARTRAEEHARAAEAARAQLATQASELERQVVAAERLARENEVLYARAQQELAERRRVAGHLTLLDAAITQSHEAVTITTAELDPPGPTIVYVNPAFTTITGYTAAEVLGQTPRILQGPKTDRAVLDRLRADLTAGRVFSGETVNYRKDGREFSLEWQVAPIRDAAGHITHYVAIQNDVTAQRREEEHRRQAQKLEVVGRLASAVAHDFNNLLQAVALNSVLLLEPDAPTLDAEAHDEAVRTIQEAADRATHLSRQLLTFSRQQAYEPRPVELDEVVIGVEPILRRLLGAEVRLTVHLDSGPGTVLADPGQLGQVVMNLALNARDAMPEGGDLRLTTDEVDIAPAGAGPSTSEQGIPPVPPGRYARLSVTDTGVGMDEEIQQHLFEPFFTTKDPGHGTGLGLATVLGIVEQAGGRITVESAPGRGTTFTVYLPIQREVSPAALGQRPEPHELPTGHETVLVVEDEPAVRRSICLMLERHGYHVVEARHGADALQVYRAQTAPVDLVLTDISMPELGGPALVAALRAAQPALPVIFMSGYAEGDPWEGPDPPPRTGFLAKPFDPATLLQQVRRVLA